MIQPSKVFPKYQKISFINLESQTCTKKKVIKNKHIWFLKLKCLIKMIYYIDIYNKEGKKSIFLTSSDEIIDQILTKISTNIHIKVSLFW
jgi:hypothetical protein